MRSKILKTLCFCVILCGLGGPLSAAPDHTSEKLQTAANKRAAGKLEEARKAFHEVMSSEKDSARRALAELGLGETFFLMGQDGEAQKHLRSALSAGIRLEDHARMVLGHSLRRSGQVPAAKAEFEKVAHSKSTTPPTIYKARHQLGEIAVAERNWREAEKHFKYLHRKLRRQSEYPDVIWRLIGIERALKRRTTACRYAVELYSKFPAHPLVADWGIDLHVAKHEGETLGCHATSAHQSLRIRRLQWAGENERAFQEIKAQQQRVPASRKYVVDSLLANHFINEGLVDEALKLLLSYYEKQKGNFGYLMLLGKAAARAGEVQTAVGAYHKAYELNKRSRGAKTALFQSAFLSYQFQDYDGAGRKFEEYRKMFPRSGTSQDAHWHLAWIRYLKGDYRGAYKAFAEIESESRRRSRKRRRATASLSNERIRYWMAMSLLKLEKPAEARPIFEQIAKDPALGYYSIASWYRLNSMKKEEPATPLRGLASQKSSVDTVSGLPELPPEGTEGIITSEESESEETLAAEAEGVEDSESAELAEANGDAEGESGADEGDGDSEVVIVSAFADPALARRFDRVRDFKSLGLYDLARLELYEIEKRTANPNYRRMLMNEYQAVQNYNRSSYIGDVYFGDQRAKGGFEGARPFWEFAFPKAYEQSVTSYASAFTVPQPLVWGIMRAESFFKHDVVSPVGAKGLMQIMPYTGRHLANILGVKDFQVSHLDEPDTNIKMGTRYLARLLKMFNGSIPLVAAGYNAGPHRVHAWLASFGGLDMDEFIEHVPFVETRNYVKRVVRHYQIYDMLYRKPERRLTWLAQPVGVKLAGPVPTRESWDPL